MQLRHAARTDAGRARDHNEDFIAFEAGRERAEQGALFVVCDGIGGYARGEVASELAARTITSRFYAYLADRPAEASLLDAIEAANAEVFQQGGGKMGTTGVMAYFHDDAVMIANVGDCRAYLVRDGKPRQITRDHSFVAEQVAAGMLTEQQARESSYRNIITRAIGHRPDVEVDVFREPLLKNDIVVLCSDGLHGQVEPSEIALAVTRVPLDDACRALIKLANDRGGPDNITIVAVRVVALTIGGDDQPSGPGDVSEWAQPREATADDDRIEPSGASSSPAPQGTTQRMVASAAYTGVDRRSGRDRRSLDEQRQATADRRAPTPPGSAAVYAAPAERGSAARSFVLWMIALAVLAAIVIGGYFAFFVWNGGPAPAPTTIGPPTQTPLSARPTLTLVPTPSVTPQPSSTATP